MKKISYLIVVVLLVFSSWVILLDANWFIGDDHQFISRTVQGKLSHSWMLKGRFWPLGLLDYSILLIFFEKPEIWEHLTYNVILMFIACLVYFKVLEEVSEKKYFIALFGFLLLLSNSSFFQIHMECIYSERLMFFVQALFMYFWIKGYKTSFVIYYILAWVCATSMMYMKEPVFGMFSVVALTNLVFGWNQISEKEKAFHFSILISVGLFLGMYLFVYSICFVNIEDFYSAYKGRDCLRVFLGFIKQDPIVVVIFLLSLLRGYQVLIKADRKNLKLDSLLFGGVSYICAYVILKFPDSYYNFPSIVFVIPCVINYLKKIGIRNKKYAYHIISSCVILMLPSIKHSYDKVNNLYDHRRNDFLLIDEIVDLYLAGEKIYFFTEDLHRKEEKDHMNWTFRAWMVFLDYCSKKRNINLNKDYHKDHIFIVVNDFDKLPEHCIVFCCSNLNPEDKEKIKRRYKFKFYNIVLGSEIYGN